MDGFRLNFVFEQDTSGEYKNTLSSGNNENTIHLYNAPLLGAAFDMGGFTVDNQPVTIHLAFSAIGGDLPHRVITYTVSAADPEATPKVP